MADETSQDQIPEFDGAATPNRDRRPEPPIIEGEVAESREVVDAPPAADPPGVDREPAREPPAPASSGAARPAMSAAIGALVGAIVAAGSLWILDQNPPADPGVVARLDRLEHDPPTPAALPALDKRVAALEAELAGAPDKASLDAYGQRIAALESASLSAKAAADTTKDALSTLQAAREDAAKALALATTASQNANGATSVAAPAIQADGAPGPDLGALEGRIGKLEASLAALDRAPVDLDAIHQRLDKLESSLAAPKSESRVPAESPAPSRDAAGLAVAAQALDNRLRAGAPFPEEQAALEHLGADPARLAILKPLAEKGAPTAAVLAADFAKVAPAVIVAATPGEAGGVMERLKANLSKVVRVTPVGEVAGDDPEALVSQIKATLGRGQIAPALALWARLPEPAQQASKEWANAAQTRLGADRAAQGVIDDAMARLAAANN
jgi:hypothetical protein